MAKEPPLPVPKMGLEETLQGISESLDKLFSITKALGDEVSRLRMELDELKANQ